MLGRTMLERLKAMFAKNPTEGNLPTVDNVESSDITVLAEFNQRIEKLKENTDFPKRALEALQLLEQALQPINIKSLDIEGQIKIEKMLQQDIPHLLEIYCSLPKGYAVSYILENGKTSKETLIEQIHTFIKTINNLSEDILVARSNQLLKSQKKINTSNAAPKDFFDL